MRSPPRNVDRAAPPAARLACTRRVPGLRRAPRRRPRRQPTRRRLARACCGAGARRGTPTPTIASCCSAPPAAPTRSRRGRATPTPSSSATPPTSSTAARARTASSGGPGSTRQPRLRPRAGRSCGPIFVTHLHADHIMDLANLFVGQLAAARRSTSTGPAPAGLPIPAFPPDADRAARLPRRADARASGPPSTTSCGPSPTTSTCASPTRAAPTSPSSCGCTRSASAATATCPTSTSA